MSDCVHKTQDYVENQHFSRSIFEVKHILDLKNIMVKIKRTCIHNICHTLQIDRLHFGDIKCMFAVVRKGHLRFYEVLIYQHATI